MIGGSSPLEQSIINAMNEYVLHVAEQAVMEEIKKMDGHESLTASSNILSRIKTLTKKK